MATLSDIEASAPDLVALTRTVISSCTNAVLGTYRLDGSIRLSGIDPVLSAGEIVIGSMPGARKLADLRRDPRLSLHSVPWESRRVAGGAEHVEADVKIDGHVVELDGEQGSATFRIEIDLLSAVRVVQSDGGPALEISTWTARVGLRTTRRS